MGQSRDGFHRNHTGSPAQGLRLWHFPMAESAEDPALYWIEPDQRGVIPLERFHLPGRLARTVRSDRFAVTVNRDFDAVIDGCAAPQTGRPRTWINTRIRGLYRKLYERRHCHSIEVYEGDTLVGGLYGVTLGRAFFGESMFHTARDASKVALVHLIARLKAGGFKLLDTQFVTDHLRTFGAIEVPRRQYHKLLEAAIGGRRRFFALGGSSRSAERRRSINWPSFELNISCGQFPLCAEGSDSRYRGLPKPGLSGRARSHRRTDRADSSYRN